MYEEIQDVVQEEVDSHLIMNQSSAYVATKDVDCHFIMNKSSAYDVVEEEEETA